jgi:hypothetical protein
VFALFVLAYCPFFLARYGPYVEDSTFLAALNRMNCGQVPYRDFAFLYGPLMIYPAAAWTQALGFGMWSYYAFLALLEGVQFTIVMAVLQHFVPQRRYRYMVFLILLPFLFNNLLGLNYNGMRWLVPALIVLLAAYRPFDRRANLLCAGLLGLHLAYSHEYALAALAAVLGIYALQYVWDRSAGTIRAAAIIALGGVAVWLVAVAVVLRSVLPIYLAHASDIVSMMSAGHAGFRFYWTANALALFGLLTIACMTLGRGWRPRSGRRLESGDRLLLGGVCFALVALRSGFTRSDVWHLNPGFLPLLLAFLLPLPAAVMALSPAARRLAFGLAIVASATVLVGIAPTGSLYATSYVRGFMDTVVAEPRPIREGATRSRAIERERSHPRTEFVALGRYLAEPQRVNQPVLFYGRAWNIPVRVGVCPADYKLDDLLYSEFRQPEAVYLRAHPDALVVMRGDDYRRLYGLIDPDTPHSSTVLTPVKQLGRWLSTVHYDAAETEARLQDETRARLTGAYIRSRYAATAGFGDYVVLAPLKELP